MIIQQKNAFIYALIVAMGGFLFGIDAALIAGTVDNLTSAFDLTSIQLGTVVSAPALGVLIALPFAGYISNQFGRRRAIIIVAILYLVSALGSAFATSYWTLVTARLLGGLAFSSISLASMYIGEIAPPKWRGKLVTMIQINIVVGLSGAYFINYVIFKWAGMDAAWVKSLAIDTETWRWMLGSEIPFAVLWFFLLMIIPESPSWLFLKGRKEDARDTLGKLLPADEVELHIEEMTESLQKSTASHSWTAQCVEIFSKPMRRILIIALTIGIAQQLTGINAILFYAQTVFKQVGIGEDAAFTQAVWIGLVSVFFTLLGLCLIDRVGRRPMIIGGMLWIITSLGLCAYAFNEARYTLTPEMITSVAEAGELEHSERLASIAGVEYGSDIEFKNKLKEVLGDEDAAAHQGFLIELAITMDAKFVLFGILSFIGAFQFSIGPVMWVLFSEIFPITVRGLAIPFFTIVTSLTSYVVQKFFPWQLENMGMSSIFMFYAGAVSIGLVILFFTLKETKNLTIEEIQAKLCS